jgi:hypothetical protein
MTIYYFPIGIKIFSLSTSNPHFMAFFSMIEPQRMQGRQQQTRLKPGNKKGRGREGSKRKPML